MPWGVLAAFEAAAAAAAAAAAEAPAEAKEADSRRGQELQQRQEPQAFELLPLAASVASNSTTGNHSSRRGLGTSRSTGGSLGAVEGEGKGHTTAAPVSADDGIRVEATMPAAQTGAAGSEACVAVDHPVGAAIRTLAFHAQSNSEDNTKAQHRPKSAQLHRPRARVGHTISPFNLPAKAPQQQKQQRQTPTCSREEDKQQKQQKLHATAKPLSGSQENSSGDSNINRSGSRVDCSTDNGSGGSRRKEYSSESDSSHNNYVGSTEVHWARSLVRPIMVGGCCAVAAAAAAAASPDEALHRVIEKTSEVAGDAFLGFTAAEAAASLRQTPFTLLQEAVASAAARRQQPYSLLPDSPPSLPAAAERQRLVATAATTVLDGDWLESYISYLCAAGSSCWLWWRLQLADAPGGPGFAASASTASGVVTPERRVHHAAASVSAERRCSAVAVFGGRKASGDLADNELYLLEVTPLLSLDLPLFVLGDLLSVALSESAQGVTAANAAAEAELGAALCTDATAAVAVTAREGSPTTAACANGASQQLVGDSHSISRGGSNISNPPLLRWRVPLCVGQKPSPRLGHSLVYAEPHLILYGGKDERGRLLNDVWLLDIFDWRRVVRPTAASEVTASGAASGNVESASMPGEATAAAATTGEAALSWVTLDFSSSPLKPPGRFLHSCSVFFTSAGDGSCSIVIGGGWTSVVLPRARLYALHRNAKGRWRHGILPVRVTNAADRRFMHASVCAGSSLLLSGGLQIRLGAAPTAHLCCWMFKLVGHQAWHVGGRVFSYGGLKINEDDSEPLSPVPVHRVVVLDACDLLPASSAEPLLATRHQVQLQLQRRAGAYSAARTQQLPFAGSNDAPAARDAHCFGESGSSRNSSNLGQVSMEQQQPATSVSYSSSDGAKLPQQTSRIGAVPRGSPSEPPLAAATSVTMTAEGASGGSIPPRERAHVDAYSSCSGSKRPCSRPLSFDSSSVSKQETTPQPAAGATAGAALPDVAAGGANGVGNGSAATFEQLQGQGERREGRVLDAVNTGVIHPPSGGIAANALAAAATVSAGASSETCHPSDATVCTPRRYRRMAALQALESFKLLPDPIGATAAGAPTPAPTSPAPAAAAAVTTSSTAEGI
ncbi:uncharacterized protein EMH_0017800 [Eimeria mitis]|uniref:Kelch motif domain-containing protein n=1 Tax=Eimeria mitis TaxID=44415 RepID=U6KD42_9EIME|nr:uncharacterized protein EMH_0017800 [Eimeria mitis]CDJ35930.1 hypothetical protein, conserved [Eimeria mitis]